MAQTNETAFETYVEHMLLAKGWQRGWLSEWDKENALFPKQIFAFIAVTQPQLWEAMRGQHGAQLEAMLLSALVRELAIKGSLHVLRHGFKFYGKAFRLAAFKPAHGLNEEVQAHYLANQLTLTRQVPCHPGDHSTIDLVFAVNGLPVATCELKNPWTGQSWRHAVRQYQEDRNPRASLFTFKQRALVHFAADPDAVYMTTKLAADKTFFLPFNRGSHPGEVQCGAGNPQHSSGYRSGYFWEEILERESFLDILGHFLFLDKKEEKVDDGKGGIRIRTRETMIFPRYHQLDATRKLIATARTEGPGQTYLIQHSAGSGKTNSISWLSHRLATLHDESDHKVFDCVIVITDWQVLDRQLQDAIYQIEHAQGVVKAIDQDSKQLASALFNALQEFLQFLFFHLKAMFRCWKRAILHLIFIGGKRLQADLAELAVLFDKFRRKTVIEAQKIVHDQHLAITLRACANADGGDREVFGNMCGQGGRNSLQHHGKAACILHGPGIIKESFGGAGIAALHLEAAQAGGGLRGQANMALHRNACGDDCCSHLGHFRAALQLNRIRSALFQKTVGIGNGLAFGAVVGTKGHVGNN